MAIADDLLTLASHLTTPAATDPEQAWLRRSISTAYYALFHLLVQEAAQRWTGSQASRLGLERTFKHDQMKDVSRVIPVPLSSSRTAGFLRPARNRPDRFQPASE